MRRRDTTRVLLLDPYDRLLLLQIHDPDHLVSAPGRPAPDRYWITVGGGLEPSEGFADAAHREIFEETAIRGAALGPALWDRQFELLLAGEPVHGVERYFVAWTEQVDVSFAHVTEDERAAFVDRRWWTYAEVADEGRTATIFPDEIVTLFQQALVLGRPTETG